MKEITAKDKVGTNLTEGPVFKALVAFACPIILANLIQQLYGMVDLMVIGRFVGSKGTVGVSIGGEMSDMVTPVATAFAMAGQTFIAQLFGAKEEQKVKDTVGTFLTFMMILSVLLTGAAVVFCRPILHLLNCPEEALSQARSYLIITAAGFPFIFGYNAVCGILRGMGESKRPLLFVSVAAAVNIVLDLVLVILFDMQAAGTAIATTLSQFGSFAAALIYMYRRREKFDFEVKLTYFKIRKDILMVLIRLGIPSAVRALLVRFSLLWVNSNINSYGLVVSATNSVGNKIQKFLEVFMQGVDTASAAMIGQNLGAKKVRRAARVTWSTLCMTMICAAAASFLCLAFPKEIFSIFTSDEAVMELGVIYLRIMVIHYFSSAFVGAFQAMVNGSGFVELGFAIGILDGVICKIGLSLIFVNVFCMEYIGYFLGIGCSRILPGILCFLYFMSGKWKRRKLLL